MLRLNKTIRTVMAGTIVAASICSAPVGAVECRPEPQKDPALMAVDATLARPVGVVATVTGFALFLVSSPFSALGGNTHEAWDSLVVAPAAFTFKRPLGQAECEPPPMSKEHPWMR